MGGGGIGGNRSGMEPEWEDTGMGGSQNGRELGGAGKGGSPNGREPEWCEEWEGSDLERASASSPSSFINCSFALSLPSRAAQL